MEKLSIMQHIHPSTYLTIEKGQILHRCEYLKWPGSGGERCSSGWAEKSLSRVRWV